MSYWWVAVLGISAAVLGPVLDRLYEKHYGDDETAGLLAVFGIAAAMMLLLAVVAGISYVVFDW